MNANNATKSVDSNHASRVIGGTVTALAIGSIAAGLFFVTGLDARPTSMPSHAAQGQLVGYFPAQFDLKPAAKEFPVFEY